MFWRDRILHHGSSRAGALTQASTVVVEVVGGSPMVQHYVEEIAEQHRLRLVSNSDVFARPAGQKWASSGI